MIKKITLSAFLFPLLIFSSLYAGKPFLEEHIELALPEEEEVFWTKRTQKTNQDSRWEHLDYHESSFLAGKHIEIDSRYVDWAELDKDYTKVLDTATKLDMKLGIMEFSHDPCFETNPEVAILYRSGTEIMLLGEYERPLKEYEFKNEDDRSITLRRVVILRTIFTPSAIHNVAFSCWKENSENEDFNLIKWVEILKNATIEKTK
ncbi:MAG: hypothetical protein WAM28_06915 [Chlamydiales bacterium]